MLLSRLAPGFVLAAIVLGLPGLASAQDTEAVTTCGQVMTKKHAVLTADLDCSAETSSEPTVVLRPGGLLDLGGFTLTGRTMSTVNVPTVACFAKCEVLGPGTIVGNGLPTTGGPVVGAEPTEDDARIVVRDATITGGQVGVAARRVDLIGATINGAREIGVLGNKVDVRDSVVSGNGTESQWAAFNGSGGPGIWAHKQISLRSSTVTGNGVVGIVAPRVKMFGTMLDGTDVSGNGVHADCATEICADLASERKPKLDEFSSCGRSVRDGDIDEAGGLEDPLPITETWGVCTLD